MAKKLTKAQRLSKVAQRLQTARGMLTITVPSDIEEDTHLLIQKMMPGASISTRIYSVETKPGVWQDRTQIQIG
jgi:hypothetical protein